MTGNVLKRRSAAKINWYLRVLGKRDDGFHELDSLVSEITLYDDLTFAPASNGISSLACDRADVPLDERNLILRAVRQLATVTGTDLAMNCRLTKRIPLGGGLGGGSSNAATTLMTVNAMFDLGLTRSRLGEIAAQVGSDVVFFLYGGTAIMRGRGERVEPVPPPWQGWVVLLMPELSISTADVYRAWQPQPVAGRNEAIDLTPARSAREWMSRLVNMLEPAARRVCPPLGSLMDEARRIAEREVRLSGSGACMFTAYDDRDQAEWAAEEFRRRLKVKCRPVQLHSPQNREPC